MPLIEGLTKEQLLDVADHYQVTLSGSDKNTKKTPLKVLKEHLFDKGALESKYDSSSDEKETVLAELAVEERQMALREKEWEKKLALKNLELKKLEQILNLSMQSGSLNSKGIVELEVKWAEAGFTRPTPESFSDRGPLSPLQAQLFPAGAVTLSSEPKYIFPMVPCMSAGLLSDQGLVSQLACAACA